MTEDERLSVDEAAKFLTVHPRTLRDAISRGQVPAARIGRRIVISKSVLLAALGVVPETASDAPHDPRQAISR